jgi:glycosyltransferase involved in cell wall biosynthesis
MRNILNPVKIFEENEGYRNFVYNNLIYRECKKEIGNYKPDIIHITHPRLFCAVFNTTIPFIVSCHSEEITNSFPICYSLLNSAMIHCNAKATKNLVLKIVPDREKDIVVIYPSVNLESYQSKKPLKRKNQIITLSRLEKAKNIDTIIRSMVYLPKDIFNKYNYIIIGKGREYKNLRYLANKLGLDQKISFFGTISEQEKINLLTQSKLFVLCPKPFKDKQEGFGIVFIEAQAAGLPVISSKVGGIPEAVGDGGIFVENELDPKEVAQKISQLIMDKNIYDKKKINISRRISLFDKNKMIDQIIQIYHKSMN